jgi:hypothetical protein
MVPGVRVARPDVPLNDFLRWSYDVGLLMVAVGALDAIGNPAPLESFISAARRIGDKVHRQLEKRRALERTLADFRSLENLVQQRGPTVLGSLK